ncbi:MAG TPA: SpoIID/LytB domain-containing protein [Acidimicrobiales bacterium]|nr:SpoIID/LytB domain-containing protein [Acidimicrobiales bacterium]
MVGKNERMWRLMLPATATVAILFPASAGGAGRPVPIAVLEGRGFGHGVGMAQDGAYWMGRSGASTKQILNQFYPGTRVARAGGEVRVAVLATTARDVVVEFPAGGEIRDARDGSQSPGFPVLLRAGSQAVLRFDGRAYSVDVGGGGRRASLSGRQVTLASSGQPAPGSSTTTTSTLPLIGNVGTVPTPTAPGPDPLTPPSVAPAPSTTTTVAPPAPRASLPTSARGLWAVPAGGGTVAVPARSQRYRGVVQVAGGGGSLRLVNHVDVEQYLRGMGEVRDPKWPAAALRAQAIAARTYALRAVSGGGELCDTQQCQVYLGAGAEYGAMDKAVSQTRGQVVMSGRRLAATVYSANGGGSSATTEEGFGTPGGGYPYLRPASYPTQDTFGWTVRVSLRDVGRRMGYRGTVTGVRVSAAGPSGRALQVTLQGGGGPRSYPGLDFRRALALRSTLFTAKVETAAVAPPPPPPADGGPAIQALPDQGGGEVVDGTATASSAGTAGAPAAAAEDRAEAGVSQVSRPVLAAVAWLLLIAVVGGLTTNRLGRRGPPPLP